MVLSRKVSKLILLILVMYCVTMLSFFLRSRHSTWILDSSTVSEPENKTLLKATYSPTTPRATLDIDKACPANIEINSQNNHVPFNELMGLEEIRSILKYWYVFNCPLKESCNFASIGQHLLHFAIQTNKTLYTLQIGAMDGKSNDPLYDMFVRRRKWFLRGRKSFEHLQNWLPVMIEPVPVNYEALIETYSEISKTYGLGCAIPIRAAVSYDTSKEVCPFCQTNVASDAPDRCKKMADWIKFQMGTLDCEHSKFFHKDNFELCILQDPVPCSSITNLLSKKSVSSQNIAMLQIDIEGYEYILLDGFIKEIEDNMLPLIIHFEKKVMKELDWKIPLAEGKSRLDTATQLLKDKGYTLHSEGEDCLAVRLPK